MKGRANSATTTACSWKNTKNLAGLPFQAARSAR